MLSNLGRREDALKASQEAVDIRRALAKDRPGRLPAQTSRCSLNNTGAMLSNLGRREDALKASQEAVDIYRRPRSRTGRTPSSQTLASSLNNLGQRPLQPRPPRGRPQGYRRKRFRHLSPRPCQAQRQDAFTPGPRSSPSITSAIRLSNRLFGLGRREDALKASQEAVDIYRALAKDRPDAFLPDLATSISVMSDVLAAMERPADAAAAAQDALSMLAPFVERYPQNFGQLARTIGSDVLKYCGAAGIEPDTALLQRVAKALGGGEAADGGDDDPALAALKSRIAAIIENAERTGALDETALAELPPELAQQLRAAWVEHAKDRT